MIDFEKESADINRKFRKESADINRKFRNSVLVIAGIWIVISAPVVFVVVHFLRKIW